MRRGLILATVMVLWQTLWFWATESLGAAFLNLLAFNLGSLVGLAILGVGYYIIYGERNEE